MLVDDDNVVTYGWIDEAEKYNGADDGPDGFHSVGLETLGHYLIEAVTHAAQLRGEPVRGKWGTAQRVNVWRLLEVQDSRVNWGDCPRARWPREGGINASGKQVKKNGGKELWGYNSPIACGLQGEEKPDRQKYDLRQK